VNNLLKQHVAMLATEGLKVEFTDDGVKRIAHVASRANAEHDNTGARRLHTVLERILEPVSFDADALGREGQAIVVDAAFVDRHTGDMLKTADLKKFII